MDSFLSWLHKLNNDVNKCVNGHFYDFLLCEARLHLTSHEYAVFV